MGSTAGPAAGLFEPGGVETELRPLAGWGRHSLRCWLGGGSGSPWWGGHSHTGHSLCVDLAW